MVEPHSTPNARTDALVENLFGASIATMELYAVYIGDRLGYYRALSDGGAATSTELARRTNTYERYAREWLEQQATAGVLDVTETGEALTRQYELPAAFIEIFTDRDSLNYMVPLLRLVVGIAQPMGLLLNAYRNGGGVPYPEFGVDTREGIAEMNRAMFINQLCSEWIVALPDIVDRLNDLENPARVADIGCGTGWSSIALAQGYPAIHVDGLDLDEASITQALVNALATDVADRVNFQQRDAADPALAGQYDLACAFECIHDLSDPVGVLAAMRGLVGEGGTVLIADERVADQFTANGDEIERLMYGFSVLHCLPVGMAESPSAGTGTVMRADTLRAYAAAAGYQDVQVLPVENTFWRFYRLTA